MGKYPIDIPVSYEYYSQGYNILPESIPYTSIYTPVLVVISYILNIQPYTSILWAKDSWATASNANTSIIPYTYSYSPTPYSSLVPWYR